MMSEDIIREITRQIVQEQLLYNWAFYLVLLALLFLSSVSSAFVDSYIRKRGETYATKADLEQLIRQLRATTTAAEEVKTAIAHSDWTSKEWKTLRRVKLEELVGALYAVEDWLEEERDVRLFSKSSDSNSSPLWKIQVMSGLYFNELHDEVAAFVEVHHRYTAWMMQVQVTVAEVGNDTAKKTAVLKAHLSDLNPHFEKFLLARAAIERKASVIMKDIVGI